MNDNTPVLPGRMNLLGLLILTAVTSGIYTPVWFLQRRRTINALPVRVRLRILPFVMVIVLDVIGLGVSLLIGAFDLGRPWVWRFGPLSLNVFSVALMYATLIVTGVQSYRVRRAVQDYLKRGTVFSWLGTFLFQVLYLQYVLNRLPENQRND